MDQIQHQLLELVSVGLCRLDEITVLIEIRYFFLYHMKRHRLTDDPVQRLHLEQIIQDHAEVISRLSLLILRFHHLIRKLIVLHDGRAAVFQTHNPHLLVRSCLAYHLSSAFHLSIDGSTDKTRVTDSLENIIYRKNIDPLDPLFSNDLIKSGLDQRGIPTGISVRRGGQFSFFLQIQMSVVVTSRCHLLFEKADFFFRITEVFFFFQKCYRRVVIFFAGHDKQTRCGPYLIHHIQKVFDETLEDKYFLCQSDIIHPLGIIRSESCSHSAGQQKSCRLPLTDRVRSDFPELILSCLNFIFLHRPDGSELPSRICLFSVLGHNRQIRVHNLFQKILLFVFAQLVIKT